MSIVSVKKDGSGDEYYTPAYVVEVLLPYLKQKTEIKTIWCPCDKEESEYVKVLENNGYKVIHSHIDEYKDFLEYEPSVEYDAIITNPPFSIKNQVVKRCIDLGKPWALLLSATCIQSASLVRILSEAKQFQYIIFDKRISYSGDRPPFPSWYFTSGLLNENKFYIYKRDPKELYKEWISKKELIMEEKNEFKELFDKMSYEEFVTKLIMFEKALDRDEAEKIADRFISSNLASIFELQSVIDFPSIYEED